MKNKLSQSVSESLSEAEINHFYIRLRSTRFNLKYQPTNGAKLENMDHQKDRSQKRHRAGWPNTESGGADFGIRGPDPARWDVSIHVTIIHLSNIKDSLWHDAGN